MRQHRRPIRRPPNNIGIGQIDHHHRRAVGHRVQARPLVGLQLEQLQVVDLLRGGRHQMQVIAQRVGEQQSRRRDIQQLCALLGELGEQVNNVEVVEQTVHQRDDRVQDASFTR